MTARHLAKRLFNHLDKQIREAQTEINGLLPEYDERQQYEQFIESCIIQRATLARDFGFRL